MIAVFLDRDGVINENREDYVKSVDEFVFLPGALEAIAKLKKAGVAVVVVSNQAGVGRGLIDLGELDRMNRAMIEAVEEAGGSISALYYCPHRKDEGCGCRKPRPGLFLNAGADLSLDLSNCFLVGDAETDVEAGQRAGCRTVLVLTGRSKAVDVTSWDRKPDHISVDLLDAVEWILIEIGSR